MAEELNYTIPQLNDGIKYTDPKAGDLLVIHDLTNGKDKAIDISFLMPAAPSTSYAWVSNFPYLIDQIVEYGGMWWQSLDDDNEGNIPTEGDHWTKVNKSASGFVKYTPGIFSQDEVFVLNGLDGFQQLFQLSNDVTRPFNSTNFQKEFTDGIWSLASERGYIGIQRTAHGFSVNNVLTFKSGNWNKFTTGNRPLAIVKTVVDSDGVIAVVIGDRVKGFSGLIPGTVYYAQADGTLSIVESVNPVMIAISATESILLYSGASSDIEPPAEGVYAIEYGPEYI